MSSSPSLAGSPAPASPIAPTDWLRSVMAGLFIGLVVLVLAGLGPTAIEWSARAVFTALAAVLAWHDWQSRRLPNRLLYPGILAAAALSPSPGSPSFSDAWLGAAAALAACTVLLGLSSLPRLLGRSDPGLGFGDLKLTVLLGLLLGWRGVLVALWAGTLLAAIPAGIMLAKGRRDGAFAFGPCLIAGGFVAAAWLLAG